MSLDYYLVQYTPDFRRLERFNVGLFVKVNDDVEVRFLSDDQWQERFGPGGSVVNWKAWRSYFDRVMQDRGLSGILDDSERAAVSTYTVIHASERILGDDPRDVADHADETFEQLVL